MDNRWDVIKFDKRLREAGVDKDLAQEIALDVADKVHFEKGRAIIDFKKRILAMWETDYFNL